MNLLIFNLRTDETDAPLAFTSEWVRAFARHCDKVVVLTMGQGPYSLPEHVQVYDIGHGKNYSDVRLAFNFYYRLCWILWKHDINACFCHMNVLFLALGGWLLKLKGIPVVTWYAHPSVTLQLKIAHFFSNHTVASLFEAYPYKKDKLHVIGQGINTELFAPDPNVQKEKIILYTGRVAPSKNIHVLLNAFHKVVQQGLDTYKLLIIGNLTNKDSEAYYQYLLSLIKMYGLDDKVVFQPAVLRTDLPAVYNRARVYVNLTPKGFGDKVAWEAMACGVPTLVCNTDMAETLGVKTADLLFEYGSDTDLAAKLLHLLQQDEDAHKSIGNYLRQQVIALHNLADLPLKVLRLFNT